MASRDELLALIPEGSQYNNLRWAIMRVAGTFPTELHKIDPEDVERWVAGIDSGEYTDAEKRNDIFEYMVGEDIIMETYGVDQETAQALISGEKTFESMGAVDPYEPQPGQDLIDVPGRPEVWKIDGETYLVYTVPDTEPPIYLSWHVSSQTDINALVGPDQTITYDREITQSQADGLGVLNFGDSRELANYDEDPFLTWEQTMAIEAESQPWILEPDYQALVAMAILEGRTTGLTEAEIQSTDWWQRHTEAQREWMKKYHGDPQEAQRLLDDNRMRVARELIEAGIENASTDLINYMADAVTKGDWSVTKYQEQIKAVADPYSGYVVDEGIADLVTEATGVTQEGEAEVEAQVTKWLGPVHGQWDDAQIAEWAGKIRNDPDALIELTDFLKNQRLALFPEYSNVNLTYNDIAAPWKGFVTSIWGQTADETDPMFATLLKNNDSAVNGQLLRQEGFNRNIGKVVQDAQLELLSSAGGSVRRTTG